MTDRARDLDQLQKIATLARPQRVHDVAATLDQEVERLNQSRALTPRTPPEVVHKDHSIMQSAPTITDIGRMSAEAQLAQFENTAHAFKTMGAEVTDRIAKLQASLEEADGSMKLLEEAFKAITEKGKLAHAQVEEMNGVNKHIRELHEAVMKKVAG